MVVIESQVTIDGNRKMWAKLSNTKSYIFYCKPYVINSKGRNLYRYDHDDINFASTGS